MRELYTKPVVKVDEFQSVEILTDSGDINGILQGDGGED